MNTPTLICLLSLPLCLSQCVPPPAQEGSVSQQAVGSGGDRALRKVIIGSGRVTIHEGNRLLSTTRTAMPVVELTQWFSEQEQIVVKSRAAHGPATVQLLDCGTGRELGRVMAHEIVNGQPAWAATMAE